MSVSGGGGSMKSKWMRSLMPRLFSMRTTLPRLVRWIWREGGEKREGEREGGEEEERREREEELKERGFHGVH